MQPTGNSTSSQPLLRLGANAFHLSLPGAAADGGAVFVHHPFSPDADVAGELATLLTTHTEALAAAHAPLTVLLPTRYVTVPADDFVANDAEALYRYAISDDAEPLGAPLFLPELSTYVLFSVPQALDAVVRKYGVPHYRPAATALWQYAQRQQAANTPPSLYAYAADESLELFAVNGNRLKFANRFAASHAHDVLYYILFVWEQLGLRHEKDRLRLLGMLPQEEWLTDRLRTFLLHVEPHAEAALCEACGTQTTANLPADLLAAANS